MVVINCSGYGYSDVGMGFGVDRTVAAGAAGGGAAGGGDIGYGDAYGCDMESHWTQSNSTSLIMTCRMILHPLSPSV